MPRSHPHHLDTHHFLPPLLFLNNSCKYYSSYSSMFYNAPFNLALPHHPLARTSAPSLSLAHAPKPHCILQGVFLWGLCWEVVEKKEKKEEKKALCMHTRIPFLHSHNTPPLKGNFSRVQLKLKHNKKHEPGSWSRMERSGSRDGAQGTLLALLVAQQAPFQGAAPHSGHAVQNMKE